MMTMPALLQFLGVSKSFKTLQALDGVSLTVVRGAIHGLLGPNGAGKSTLMSVISGILEADSGEVRVNGEPVSASDRHWRRMLGLVPQQVALYPSLSPLGNLAVFGSIYGLSRRVVRERGEQLLREVGLWDRRHDRVKDFSGGMQRRLNIAASLIHEPACLLCDEPTVGVDPQSRNAIFEFLEARRAQGLTVLYTTHYMEEAARLCDRISIIDHGRIIAEGSQSELLDRLEGSAAVQLRATPETDELVASTRQMFRWERMGEHYLGEIPRGYSLSAFYSRVERAGVPYRMVRLRQPNLEELFLQLTGRSLRE